MFQFGRTPLHLAAERGHVILCDILIRHRAFINSKTKLGYTPLHFAAKFGHPKLFNLLVQQHMAPTDVMTMENQTPLHIAAKYGQISFCQALLNSRANTAVRDIRGRTPLHLAAENDHPEIVQLFLTKSSNEGTLDITDENGLTCAHIAALKGSLAVIKGLMTIDRNMVVNAKTKDTNSTALHMAVAGGHTEIVRVLLEGGASPLEENSRGMAALHLAAEHGHVDILNVIDKIYWKICSKKTGLNALHVAAYYGQKEFVRNILVNVSATCKSEPPGESNPLIVKEMASEYCLTPLHMAAQSEHEGLIRLLLNVPGVQVDMPTATMNVVPLHLAAHSGHLAVVGQLLSRGTQQINARDYKGRTPLHIAASEGHFETVSLLLSQGATINIMDQVMSTLVNHCKRSVPRYLFKNGWTPMHFATIAGHLKVIKFLIERGADPAAECLEGKIPMCFAASNNRVDCLMYLLKQKYDTYQLMENKKFIFDLMVCGKNHRNKPIEEFIMNSAAPINTAINLSSLYKVYAAKEKERARDLNLMSEFCECIAVELMSITASEFNPALILKSLNRQGQPLIDVLIEHNQKAVVSQPSFVCHLVSHIYFTLFLTLEVLCVLRPIYEISSPIPNWFEWILLLWLSGQLVSELSPFGGNSSGFIRLIIIFLSGMATVIHVVAFTYPSMFMHDSSNEVKLHFTRSVLYLQNQMMALALLISFVEFLEFLTVHHLFGPWAIIIRDLMYDLARFLVILFLFMAGFTVAVASVYQPAFPNSASGAAATNISILTIAQLLFFSLFGQVTVDNMPTIVFSPSLGTTIIKIVYGVYLIVSIIVLINLLIAMMSDTYQRIQAQSDTEWKFGRAKLIRQMNKKSSTPPPVNLFTKCYVLLKVAFRNRCYVI
ncbi:unnamed protein product [Soboliphyme baturini]|uniref:Ion transport domain-containing protein n=1 Tax=Soboliphyme baturini TaxID=241478 RepID=A0A3P8CJJ5_9BILA|nr:unnamed protein product [Soboliphyme baturini]